MLHSSYIQLITFRQRWQQVHHPLLQKKNISLWLCHLHTDIPGVSGNKCLKLKYHLQQVIEQNKAGVFTFGGAFSNHLCAVAASCNYLKLRSVAYVRTDTLDSDNPTLAFCRQQGMQLIALDRSNYRQRSDQAFIAELNLSHPDLLFVPEGGSSLEGCRGVAELDLMSTPEGAANLIVSAAASGGTLAGMINRHNCPVLGIAVVRDSSLQTRVQQLLNQDSRDKQWQLNHQFTGKGYGHFDAQLLQFCRSMAEQNVQVEPIYTGKALAGVFSLIEQDEIANNSRISFFHTGGLQGLNGLKYRGLITENDFALLSGSAAD